jgi:hypothetical protein
MQKDEEREETFFVRLTPAGILSGARQKVSI